MAKIEHWDISGDTKEEMWNKIVGAPKEDVAETQKQALKLFHGMYGQTCLEIGAGVGRLMAFAGARFLSVIGTDWSRSMVNESVRYLGYRYWMRVVLVDGYKLPFGDDSFDFIYSFTCFQHMQDLGMIRSLIFEAYRVLKPGKLVRVQTVLDEHGSYDGITFPSADSFAEEFKRAGFQWVDAHVEDSWIWVTMRKPEEK